MLCYIEGSVGDRFYCFTHLIVMLVLWLVLKQVLSVSTVLKTLLLVGDGGLSLYIDLFDFYCILYLLKKKKTDHKKQCLSVYLVTCSIWFYFPTNLHLFKSFCFSFCQAFPVSGSLVPIQLRTFWPEGSKEKMSFHPP